MCEDKIKNEIEYYTKLIKKTKPSEALGEIYNQLGYLYSSIQEYENLDLQIEYFTKALEFKPNANYVLRNIAFTYYKKEDYQKTVEYLEKFFAKSGGDINSYLLYFESQIRLQNFKPAWEFYEHRFDEGANIVLYPKFRQPKWNGENISDKILLVHWEQGFGDTIMFSRLIHKVKPLAKKVIFRVQDELVELIKLNFKDIEVIGTADSVINFDFDYHIPLMSLMRVLNVQADEIPLSEGYLSADMQKILQYKHQYFDNDCLKIGIAYRGSKGGIQGRNIQVEDFYQLAKRENIKVYSFQKGVGSEQLNDLPTDVEIVDLGKTFKDFSDTAAAMANLDLFISSDNGVLNLAGAMGVKTFLLLYEHSDWRWFGLNDCSNKVGLTFYQQSPWYNSVAIFKKQSEKETWENLIKSLKV